MFTGIISDIGTIISSQKQGDLRLTIACSYAAESLRIGDSVACNGVCLTVVDSGRWTADGKQEPNPSSAFTVTLSPETLVRTAPGWEVGQAVNLERALKLGDTLDGHMVSGHVDGVAKLVTLTPSGDSHSLTLEAPEELAKFIAEKGSVTLDGVSLTVNKANQHIFHVNIIPHTWNATTLSQRKPGDRLNLEIDLIARYVARLMVG